MANKESRNILESQRVDIPDFRAIESGVIADFKMLLQGLTNNDPFILKGFNIPVSGVNGPATSLQVVVDSAVVWVPDNQDGAYLRVEPGISNEVLSSNNAKVIGSFAPNQINYLGIRFKRATDPQTADLVSFWDVDAKVEFTKTVPRGRVLNYEFVISTTDFGDTAPIAIIQTNLSNNVNKITNAKQNLFRLGSGGTTPNISNSESLSPATENSLVATSPSDPDPFAGGDWEIDSLKKWMNMVMTQIKNMLGSAYWYSDGSTLIPGVNLSDLYWDTIGSTITGKGRFEHSTATPGLLTWTSTINIRSILGGLTLLIPASSVTISDTQVAYLSLVRNQDFQPANIFTFTNGSVSISASTTITGIIAGDWIKFEAHNFAAWAKVLTVVGSSITLTASYQGATSVGKAVRTVGSYSLSVASPNSVPVNSDTFWIAKRDDNSSGTSSLTAASRSSNISTFTTSSPHNFVVGQTIVIAGVTPSSFNRTFDIITVGASTFTVSNEGPNESATLFGTATNAAILYLRSLGELYQGEQKQISDTTVNNLLDYVGSPSETVTSPDYISNIRGSSGENLTSRTGINTDAIGDEQEDRSAYLRSNDEVTWTGTQLEFTSNIILEILNTKSGTLTQHNILTAGSPIALANGESAWVSIDRLSASETLTVNLSGTLAIPAQVQADKDVIIIARRVDVSGEGYLHFPLLKQVMSPSQTVRLGAMGSFDSNVKSKYLDPISTTLPTGTSYTADGVATVNGDHILFTNLSSGNNSIYEISGVGTAIAFTQLRAFKSGFTPADGDTVRITAGDAFQEQLAIFDGTNFKVNDVVRHFDGVSADFWEQSSIKTIAIVNNTTANVFTVTYNGSQNMIISYSIIRASSLKETGELYLTTDGVTAQLARVNSYISDPGITFNASISGSDLLLDYTSTNTGSAGTLKYFVRRWSDVAGGPTGIPNYNTGGGGGSTPAAGSLNEVQYNGPGNLLAADARFKWDGTNGALDLNGLSVGVLSSGVTLNDNQVSAATAISYNATTYSYAIIEYSILRNSERRLGQFMVLTDGASVTIGEDFIETTPLGVSFTATIVGANVEIQYTTTSTGFNGTLKYSFRRWA
jgi:hypothetical protein